MAFNVIDVETGTLVRFQRKQGVAQFETPARATTYAKRRSVKDGKKYKIKVAATDDGVWIAREKQRMESGTYIDVPFSGAIWYYAAIGRYTAYDLRDTCYNRERELIGVAKTHFAHVSMANKSMLAYTESPDKGARDIQTQIKPGAYLAKYFSSVLSPDQVAAHVRDWQRRYADCELKFARTADEIVEIYQNGPNSCMSGSTEDYRGRSADGIDHHPCEVYGLPHSDLTLAYLKGKNGITARCLVWEDKKQYGRIYGDPTLIDRELRALGYTGPGYFSGAKVGKIPVGKPGKTFLMPYIDGWSRILEQPDHFLLTADAPRDAAGKLVKCRWVCAGNTHGNTGDNEDQYYECEQCGDEVTADNVVRVPGHGYYCRGCYDANFIYCQKLGVYTTREGSEDVVAVYRYGAWQPRLWCADAIEQYAFRCPIDGALHDNALKVTLDDGRIVSRRAAEAMNPPIPSPAPTPELTLSQLRIPAIDWTFNTTTRR